MTNFGEACAAVVLMPMLQLLSNKPVISTHRGQEAELCVLV